MNFAVKSGENWGDSGGAAFYNGGKQAPFSSMPASITYWPPTAGKLLTKAPQGNQQRFPEENNCLITVSAQETRACTYPALTAGWALCKCPADFLSICPRKT